MTRSIPACAGEPAAGRCCGLPTMLYPRVCGGTWAVKPIKCSATGLSPRVRGNPVAGLGVPHYMRSIPACAGEPAHTTSLYL